MIYVYFISVSLFSSNSSNPYALIRFQSNENGRLQLTVMSGLDLQFLWIETLQFCQYYFEVKSCLSDIILVSYFKQIITFLL